MIDLMLSIPNTAGITAPFAVEGLLKVRMEILNKRQRETILKGWLPLGDAENERKRALSYANATNPAILSLKLRMMEYAMFYEVSSAHSVLVL